MKAKLQKLDFSGGKKLIKTITGLTAMVESSGDIVRLLREDSEKFSGKQYDSDQQYMLLTSDMMLFLKHLVVRTDNADMFVASLAKYGIITEQSYN